MIDFGGTQVPPFKETLSKALPYVDFLFGNETEAEAFAKSEGWATEDKAEIAKKVSRLFPDSMGIIPRSGPGKEGWQEGSWTSLTLKHIHPLTVDCLLGKRSLGT